MRISLNINSQSKEEVMNELSTLPVVDNAADIVTVSGIDLAKNLFAIHGTNAAGKTVLVRPRTP
jgi:predicted ABC-class ATPase